MLDMRVFMSILFMAICVILTVVVLFQEGKSAGLGALQGQSDTYWSRNKGRSMEGILIKTTRLLAVLFMVLSLLLNMNIF
ncbi:MAG: preprotein translocase subunit SecG [Lachnospiraceae bacterium]|nr:preprotein translocase subunit SecG [Lachnospiraceae bacterium]